MNLVFAFVLSCLICLISGPILIPFLRRLKLGQTVRDDGPKTHFVKTGTPTMGGLMFMLSTIIATLIFAPKTLEVITVLAIMLCFGAVGFIDDYIKVVLKRSLGLRARSKLLFQIIFSVILVFIAVMYLDRGTSLTIPLIGSTISLNWFYILFGILVVVCSTNAVNLTDGLDGLAAGITFIVTITYLIIFMILDKTDLAIFAAALGGGLVGFLVFNFNPASIFMGDTGSLALGAVIAAFSILTGTELFLVLIGGVYVVETLSVILQVISFRLTGKRIFLMSPIHHHFELKGWHEKKVVLSFWLAAAIFAILGLVTFVIS